MHKIIFKSGSRVNKKELKNIEFKLTCKLKKY